MTYHGNQNIAVFLAVAVSAILLWASPSFAFTSEARSMCTGDAFRLCSAAIPNIPEITACMRKNRGTILGKPEM